MFSNYVTPIAAVAQRIDVAIIAEASRSQLNNFGVCAMPTSPLNIPTDLIGRTIGVNAINNIGTLTMSSVLGVNGITPDQVSFVEILFPEMATAIETGRVDAGFLPEPFLTTAKRNLGVEAIFDPCSGPTADLPMDGYVVMREFAQNNPGTVTAFRTALTRAQTQASDRAILEPLLVRVGGGWTPPSPPCSAPPGTRCRSCRSTGAAARRAARRGARAARPGRGAHRPPADRFRAGRRPRHRVVLRPDRRRDDAADRRRADRRGRHPLHGAGPAVPRRGAAALERGVDVARGSDWPTYLDGATVVIAGGNAAKLVLYPIGPGSTPQRRLTNWAVCVTTGADGDPAPQRADWARPGSPAELDPRLAQFRTPHLDLPALVAATDEFYEYPMCDRDPLPHWGSGRVTLLGDAAHPMYPMGSNGAGQAIADVAALRRHLQPGADPVAALAAYATERRPITAEIVLRNRAGGPEHVIDEVERRAPDGFSRLSDVIDADELDAIVRSYTAAAAGR